MNESKRNRCSDRLSELPDSLIFNIFWLLPIRDVVRTTKLSRRWKDLWTTSPFLNFSDDGINYIDEDTRILDKVRNIFSRALILWRGAKLLKFNVTISSVLSVSLIGDINVWVRFAKERGVNELYLDLMYPNEVADDAEAELESLYWCSSLEVLSIKGCPFFYDYDDDVDWNVNVKWDRLKSFTFHTYCLCHDFLSKALCGIPNLEELILVYTVDIGRNCCIQSTSLKKLSITKCSETDKTDEYVRNSEMKIQAPNVETLEISGIPYGKLSMDVAPLTDVTLGLYCREDCFNSGKTGAFSDIEGILEQLLPTIQHVESLTLSECSLEVLGVMNKKSLLSPFSKLKLLKLTVSSHLGSFSKHLQIARLLQLFPELKRLVIYDEYEGVVLSEDENEDIYQDVGESLEFETNLSNSFLLQLRTVEVTWAECDVSIFLFIKTLLKYANKLEKMVFRVNGVMAPAGHPSQSAFLALQKLVRMPRSSPTAQLIFCKN